MGVHCGRHTNDGVSLTSVFSRFPTREHGNAFVSDLAETIFSGRTRLWLTGLHSRPLPAQFATLSFTISAFTYQISQGRAFDGGLQSFASPGTLQAEAESGHPKTLPHENVDQLTPVPGSSPPGDAILRNKSWQQYGLKVAFLKEKNRNGSRETKLNRKSHPTSYHTPQPQFPRHRPLPPFYISRTK